MIVKKVVNPAKEELPSNLIIIMHIYIYIYIHINFLFIHTAYQSYSDHCTVLVQKCLLLPVAQHCGIAILAHYGQGSNVTAKGSSGDLFSLVP